VPGNDEKEMMDSEVSRPRDHDGDTFDVVVSFVTATLSLCITVWKCESGNTDHG
jgi:hypothetical protein